MLINAAGAGVTATIVNDGSGTPYRLALSSNSSGASNSRRIAGGEPVATPAWTACWHITRRHAKSV